MKGAGRPPRISPVFQKCDSPVYFVTICCAKRRPLLTNTDVHSSFRDFAIRARQSNVAVGRYVLMPDHLHLFVSGPAEFRLEQWVRMLKISLGKRLSALGLRPTFWQRGFFDHLLRNSESYTEKWEYVRQNPVRAGLVRHPDDWPYQGEVVAIDRV
jgi:putative transposase